MRILFVYNADRGVFNALSDVAHKTFRPETYACNLCKITYSPLGMRRAWRRFLEDLRTSRGVELEFLHRDELPEALSGAELHPDEVKLPAILARRDTDVRVLIGAETLNRCRTMEEIQRELRRALDDSDESMDPMP